MFLIGIKPLFELYTPKLKERLEKKRKDANWDPHHRLATSNATNAILSLPTGSPSTVALNNSENGSPPSTAIVGGDNASSPDAFTSNPESENSLSANSEVSVLAPPPGSGVSDKEKLEKEEAEAKIEVRPSVQLSQLKKLGRAQLFSALLMDLAFDLKLPQIGRASCRERV